MATHGYQVSPILLVSPNILNLEGACYKISQQLRTLHVATCKISLPIYPHFHQSPTQLIPHFPKPTSYLMVNKTEITKPHYHFQMQHTSQTAKILQHVTERIFHKT
jgi:hypothetical protein